MSGKKDKKILTKNKKNICHVLDSDDDDNINKLRYNIFAKKSRQRKKRNTSKNN